MGQYKNLIAILDQQHLSAEIRGRGTDLVLAVVDRQKRTLATAPFEPGDEDQAAVDVSRRLTLDGKPPPGLDWGT